MLEVKANEIPNSTVLISSSHSVCLNCNKDCLPGEGAHITRVGYAPENGIGCGIEWTHVTTDRIERIAEDACREICPDLEFVRMYEVTMEPDDE